jgi:insulysin
MGRLIKLVPVKDKDVLTILFELPYCEKEHETKPLKYFEHLIGHEGENSLLSYLK